MGEDPTATCLPTRWSLEDRLAPSTHPAWGPPAGAWPQPAALLPAKCHQGAPKLQTPRELGDVLEPPVAWAFLGRHQEPETLGISGMKSECLGVELL